MALRSLPLVNGYRTVMIGGGDCMGEETGSEPPLTPPSGPRSSQQGVQNKAPPQPSPLTTNVTR